MTVRSGGHGQRGPFPQSKNVEAESPVDSSRSYVGAVASIGAVNVLWLAVLGRAVLRGGDRTPVPDRTVDSLA